MKEATEESTERIKSRIKLSFIGHYQRLTDLRKEYVRDAIYAQDSDLWAFFFHDVEGGKPDLSEIDLKTLRGAVGLAQSQRYLKPSLPPEYREKRDSGKIG